MKTHKVDICILGAGSGGLSVAAVAAQLGLKVALLEKGEMGGDCLNYGCVPSKSLLAAAKTADQLRRASLFGIEPQTPHIDFAKVNQHVCDVIQSIAPHDSQERFSKMGVWVIREAGRFIDDKHIVAGEHTLRAKYFVIATGSRAFVPPIQGLEKIPYLTNETLFEFKAKPERLIIIGGGPIGCEMAQAYLMLGSQVVMLEVGNILRNDDPELVGIVQARLIQDGLKLYENIKINQISKNDAEISIDIEQSGHTRQVTGTHVLVATGRQPNIDDLGLLEAGIAFSKQGITVDQHMRSVTRKHVYAIGDVAGGLQFTHAANYHAGIFIRKALFKLPAKVDYRAMPWVTYTDPELAHVGLSEQQAKAQKRSVVVTRVRFQDNDRALAENATQGLLKVITTARGQVLGASIAGPHAGELLTPWILAIQNKMSLKAMAALTLPYPTLSEIHKRAASQFYAPKLFAKRTKALVKFLMRW